MWQLLTLSCWSQQCASYCTECLQCVHVSKCICLLHWNPHLCVELQGKTGLSHPLLQGVGKEN